MSRLRELQVQWNSLVPQAQARGLRGVREVRLYPEGLHERITHRQRRLDWLRAELNLTTAFIAPVVAGVQGDFTFGVELEFLHPGKTREQVAAALVAAGIDGRTEAYTRTIHDVRTWWKVTTDGSLGSYSHGSEVVSPILVGDEGFSQLTTVCRVLTSLGCKVNKSCGLHVHVGCRNETVDFFKNLVRLYNGATPVIESFLAPSRRGENNMFCRTSRVDHVALDAATTVGQVTAANDQDHGAHQVRSFRRYRKLNLQPYQLQGTVEFRQHQGTVEAEKACNWVRFCLRMCLAARKGVGVLTEHTLEALLSTLDANETETRYFMGRAAYFARATRAATATRY